MFKLVAVGGKLRGQTFELNEGDNIIGRSQDCDVSLSVEGVSKKHFKITVNAKTCYIQDLGSSNGTFINGKLIKRISATNKDQIAIPNVIFQLVYVRERVEKKEDGFTDTEMDYSLEEKEEAPKDLIGKVKFFFKTKIMQVLYSFNEQYEWNILVGILLFLFICINISVSVGPILIRNKALLITEIKKRASQYVNEVSRHNALYMARGEIQRIETKYLDDFAAGDGVEYYELIDMERRIVRPASKIDTYSNDSISINAIEYFKSTKNYNQIYFDLNSGDGEIGVAKALQVSNPRTGGLEPVGVISMRLRPLGLQNESVSRYTAYLEALIYSVAFGVIFYGLIYYLTLKSIEEIRKQTINARAKRIKELSSKLLFSEINPIREEINGLLQSVSQLDGDEDSEHLIEEDDHEYIEALYEISKGSGTASIIIDSEKLIHHSNEKAYDLIGLREDFAKDKDLTEAIEKDGLADELIRLCDDSGDREGESMSDSYELSGENYQMFAKAMMGKNGTPRAFLITFIREV